jgi:gamma-glutamylcyclotransferase (GGCT)/AIG2-like uncharacterized protein YtfP
VRHKGSKVPVLIWEIQPKDEAALDVYEGWPRLYRKETMRITVNSKRVQAMVYLMNEDQQSPPSKSYFNTIREGYASAGFDVDVLYEAAKRSMNGGEGR